MNIVKDVNKRQLNKDCLSLIGYQPMFVGSKIKMKIFIIRDNR